MQNQRLLPSRPCLTHVSQPRPSSHSLVILESKVHAPGTRSSRLPMSQHDFHASSLQTESPHSVQVFLSRAARCNGHGMSESHALLRRARKLRCSEETLQEGRFDLDDEGESATSPPFLPTSDRSTYLPREIFLRAIICQITCHQTNLYNVRLP